MPAILALLALTSKTVDTVSIPDYVVRDTRLVYDASQIPSTASDAPHGLFLASINAAWDSGHEIAEGPYINAKTGEYVEPPGSKYEIIVRGELKVVAPAFGPPPFRHMPYHWKVREARPDSEDSAFYSPFRSGGLALLGYNDAEAGARQFDATYLVPDEWKAYVAPAYAYVHAHPADFNPKATSKNRAELRHLLSGANPVLAVFAARTLCGTGAQDWNYVRYHWSDSQGVRGAAILLLVLGSGGVDAAGRLPGLLAAQASASVSTVRRQVALAGVGGLFAPRESAAYKNGSAVLDAIKADMVKSGHPYGNDPEVAYLLQLTGR